MKDRRACTASASGVTRWAFGWVLLCGALVAHGAPLPFTEEAIARGIDYTVEQTDTFGCGLAFADLDGDGDPDLITLGKTTTGSLDQWTAGIYENDGAGFFTNRSAGSGIPKMTLATGITAADYDGDGDLDLYFSNWLLPNALMRNDGGFVFTDVSQTAGVDDIGAGSGCGWGDIDNDGRLDVYLPNRTATNLPNPPFPPSQEQNRLYHNLGDGTFEDLGPALDVVDDEARSFQGAFFDYDRDGDADLYLANDKGFSSGCAWRNRLWQNTGGTFLDVSQYSGTDGCIDAMCIAIGDFDDNLFPDIYVTNQPVGNVLYLNQGDGTFLEFAEQAKVASYEVGWGSAFFDYDNDGHLDLYVCNHSAPNRLYEFDGRWPAVDMAAALGVTADGPGLSFCVATADIDNDGDLDLAVSNRSTALASDRIRLFINHEGQRKHWIKFNVIGQGQNVFGVGAQVDIRAGGNWRMSEVIAGSGFKSQNDMTRHFGLGDATLVDEIRVAWPGGTTRTIYNVAADQTYPLFPPGRLGDSDADGNIDTDDLNVFVAVLVGTETSISPVAVNDFNGDGSVDGQDIPPFVSAMLSP